MKCPIPELNGRSIDKIEIGQGIYAIGSLHWSETQERWECLADVNNVLCRVEVKIKSSDENSRLL